MRRFAYPIAGVMLLGACGTRTALLPGVALEQMTNDTARRGQVGSTTLSGRRGVAVIADDRETIREAAEALAGPLAGACSAEALGVRRSIDECLAAARERGVEWLVTCRVIEYDPYDPARLIVRVTLDDPGRGSRPGAGEATTLGVTSEPTTRGHGLESTIRIDLAARSGGWIRAHAAELGLGESPQDLLEAEILLRDPARFFPFAARHIASRVPTGSLEPALGLAETPRAHSHPKKVAPEAGPASASHALGALGDLR